MSPQLQTFRMLSIGLMAPLVFIALALAFVFPTSSDGSLLSAPDPVIALAQIVAGVLVYAINESVGFRVPALPAGLADETARSRSIGAFQAAMFRRIFPAEVIAFASLAIAFLRTDGQWLTYVIGAAISLVLQVLQVWPGPRVILKTQAALDRNGAASRLAETFGVGGGMPGIQRLK